MTNAAIQLQRAPVLWEKEYFMSFSKLIIAVALATSAAAPAAAKTNAGANAQNEAAESGAAEEKKICKKLPVTGTRMEKRTCLTKEQWKKAEELN